MLFVDLNTSEGTARNAPALAAAEQACEAVRRLLHARVPLTHISLAGTPCHAAHCSAVLGNLCAFLRTASHWAAQVDSMHAVARDCRTALHTSPRDPARRARFVRYSTMFLAPHGSHANVCLYIRLYDAVGRGVVDILLGLVVAWWLHRHADAVGETIMYVMEVGAWVCRSDCVAMQ